MAKRSIDERDGERVKDDGYLSLDEVVQTVRLVLMRDVRLNITGPITGKTYKFNGAGSILSVDVDDAYVMLDMVRGDSCCGGAGPFHIFQMAD